MIHNKPFFKLLAGIACGLAFFACKGDDDIKKQTGADKEFSFSASIISQTATTAFQSGDALNVFIKSEPSASGADFRTGIQASFSGSWTISPTVLLTPNDKVYIYAVYPYNTTHTQAHAVPVKMTAQVGYLYSGTAPSASHESPHVNLTMKHAMNKVAFNIVSEQYAGAGHLESIALGGEGFASEGTLDLVSGTITPTSKSSYTFACNQTITSEGWSGNIPQFFAFPMASTGDNITLTFRIDGNNYTAFLPEMAVNSGSKYIFKLALTPNGISILGNQTEIVPLDNEGGPITIGAYGAVTIVYTGATAELPELIGSNVSGTVYWGNAGQKESYAYPGSHTYPAPGTYSVKIESWGADQISFDDLTHVEEVDFTLF